MTQTAEGSPDTTLGGLAQGDTPVLETVLAMQMDALERSGLDAHTYVLVRLAALIALDAAPVSYAITMEAAAESGVTLEEARSVIVAIAPLVGTARITSAAGGILRAVMGAAALAEDSVPEPRTP